MKTRKHTEDCLDANDDTSVFKGKCICPDPQHTPTPWENSGRLLLGPKELKIGAIWSDDDKGHENAAFIVRAVNSHEELVKAAYRAIQALEANGAPNCEAVKELKQAIAKAEGK